MPAVRGPTAPILVRDGKLRRRRRAELEAADGGLQAAAAAENKEHDDRIRGSTIFSADLSLWSHNFLFSECKNRKLLGDEFFYFPMPILGVGKQ